MFSGRVTIQQVAAESGVSFRTVSRVLSGTGETHAPATCERVQAVARRLGYVPNTTARAVRSGRFDAVALLLSIDPDRSYLPQALLEGIQEELRKYDIHLTLATLTDRQLTDEGLLPKCLRQWMADGFLINYTHRIPVKLPEIVARFRIPSVWTNTRQKTDCVFFDDFDAARRLTRHLLELGHRRIAYVDFHNSGPGEMLHYSATDRCRGYLETLNGAGIPPTVVRQEQALNEGERIARAGQILSAPDRPTAVVAYSPGRCVLPLYLAAVTRCGLSVPQDLSLATFSPNAEDEIGIAITKMLLPEREMGQRAVELLRKKIGRRVGPQPSLCLGATLVQGETAAAPACKGKRRS